MTRCGRAGAVWLAICTVVGAGQPAAINPELRTILVQDLKFSARDLADLSGGRVVAHTLDSKGPGEVGAAGGVRVNSSRQVFIERYRDITQFKKDPGVLQIGRFSNPPALDDLAALTITSGDMDLRRCRLHDCDIRLSAGVISRFEREVDWSALDAEQRAGKLFKEVLLAHVRAYASGGPGGLTQYDDDPRPIRPAESFDWLLNRSPYLGDLHHGLAEHLGALPSHPLAGAEDFLYWSKEKFGLSPFITVTHVVIVHATPTRDVIASRNVYSSRYLDASLSVTIASDIAGSPNTFLLIYANRSIANALKGRFAGFRRAIVERRARASIEGSLGNVKRRLEFPNSSP